MSTIMDRARVIQMLNDSLGHAKTKADRARVMFSRGQCTVEDVAKCDAHLIEIMSAIDSERKELQIELEKGC